MNRNTTHNGFSLIELMIVVLIIGALVAIAIPVYNKNMEVAIRAEAIASIGTIRSHLFVYYGQEGRFPISPTWKKVIGRDWNDIEAGELDGQYFVDKNYKYRSYDGIEYKIRCSKNRILEKNVWIDETGHWKFDVQDD